MPSLTPVTALTTWQFAPAPTVALTLAAVARARA
jgi:hypothetical protein